MFAQDLSAIARPKGECNILEFAKHCRREFVVEPPRGILPQGQPLLELPGSENEPEMLLEGLLRLGDQMTIFAWDILVLVFTSTVILPVAKPQAFI